jgi:hypothetical protein
MWGAKGAHAKLARFPPQRQQRVQLSKFDERLSGFA